MQVKVNNSLLLLLTAMALMALLQCCGGDGQSSDGDIDNIQDEQDFEPWWELDDESGDGFKPCEAGKCEGGLFCNSDTGICEACVLDINCGMPDPGTGITPTCIDGHCEDLVCQSMYAVPDTNKGAGLPLFPVQPEFDTEKRLIVEGSKVFPIGFSHCPQWKFEEVKNAGFNLVIDAAPCCANSIELAAHEDYLNSARSADLFVGLLPFYPIEQIEGDNQAELRQSINQRSNHPPLLFWLIDLPSFNSETVWIDSLTDYVSQLDETHPLALAEYEGFDYTPYFAGNKPIIHTIDIPDNGDFSVAITRLEQLTANVQAPPVWARIPVFGQWNIACLKGEDCNPGGDNPDADAIETLALLAIGAGAKGLVFWGYEVGQYQMADDVDKWKKLAKVAGRIHASSKLWLASREKTLVTPNPVNPYVKVFTYAYEKATITYAINMTNNAQSLTLTVAPKRTPFCFGDESEDSALHLQRETDIELALGAHEIKVMQFAEASNPGGKK